MLARSMNEVSAPLGPLDGLRVLDLTTHVAGPYCTKLLATCGADVVKIEPPDGDPMRRCGPLDPSGESFAYLDLNVGKRGMVLDLRRDRDRLLELAVGANVVVESFRPGTLDRLGLGYEALREANPHIVLTSITCFGQTGPYRDLDATEIVLYAMGGEMYANGQPDAEPLMLAPGVALGYAGQTAAVATLASVLGGHGDWIDVSIMETLLVSVDRRGQSLVAYAYCGEKKLRDGDPSTGPPAYSPAADGWLHMTTNPAAWPAIASIVGADEATPTEQLRERWLEWSGARPKLELVEQLQAAAMPAAPVNSVADLVDDPHLASRDFFEDVGGRRHVGVFARFSDTPASLGRPAPRFGEHDGATWLRPTRPVERQRGTLPLEGIRVLDLGVVLAGPYAAMALGDLGAEVIRVESTRRFPPSTRGFLARPSKELAMTLGPLGGGYPDRDPGERPWNRYPLFNLTGRNKLGMTVDMRDEEGRAGFLRLVATADVLITNQTPGTLEKLGLGWDTCREVNHRLVYIEATSLGSTGPFRLWRGYGMEMEAIAGHDLLRHYRDREVDSNSWTVTADAAGALAISLAAQAALYARRRTGRGQYVDLSMVEDFLGLIGPAVLEYTTTGHVPEPLGNRDFDVVQGCYPCAGDDRWLVLTIRDDADWECILRATGWERDERFATNASRRAHHDELDEALAAWTSTRTREEAVERLRAEGLPVGPVLDDADAFADPHLADRGFFWEMTQADSGTHRYPGAPYRFANVEVGPRLPPVALGEHNDYVWRELIGLAEDDYRRLEADGQISMEFAPEIR
jgi:crotonobetainyl-CoA:carnitine CoA-transferase CaiB-like acyl-CoA transferase